MPKHPIYIYRTDGRVETQHISLDHMTDALKRGVGGYAAEIPPPPASCSSALDCDGERVEMPQNASYYVNEDGLNLRLESNPFLPMFVGNVFCIPEMSNGWWNDA